MKNFIVLIFLLMHFCGFGQSVFLGNNLNARMFFDQDLANSVSLKSIAFLGIETNNNLVFGLTTAVDVFWSVPYGQVGAFGGLSNERWLAIGSVNAYSAVQPFKADVGASILGAYTFPFTDKIVLGPSFSIGAIFERKFNPFFSFGIVFKTTKLE